MRQAIIVVVFSTLIGAAFAQSGPDKPAAAEADLLRAKLTKDGPERLAALDRLAELGRDAAPALPELLACLELPDEDVRLRAVLVLGGLGEVAVKPLVERLTRKETLVRLYSVWALGLMGPHAAPAADAITKILTDPDDDDRRKHANHIDRMNLDHSRPLPALVDLLGDKNADVADEAAKATVTFGVRAVELLIVAVEKKAPALSRAIACLGDIGPAAAAAAPVLGKLLESKDAVGDQAAVALGKIGKASLAELAACLNHAEKFVRHRGLQGLKLLGSAAAPCLLEHVRSKHEEMRLATIYALAALRVSDREVAQAFVDALSDPEPAVRRAGIDSLARLGLPAAAPGLEPLTLILLETHAELRIEARSAFKTLKHDPIPALRGLLKDKDMRRRVAAGETLAYLFHDKSGVAAMVEGLTHADPPVRFQAAFGLGFAQAESAKALLVLAEMQKSPDHPMRGLALSALQRFAAVDEDAIPLMIAALTDANSHIRFHAAVWLGDLGLKAKAALPALTKTLDDANLDVALHTAWAIPKVGGSVETAWPGVKRAMLDEKMRYVAEYWLNQKGPEWNPLLIAGLEAPEAPIRLTCVCTLGHRLKATPKAMTLMETIALTDKNAEVRRCSAAALAGIGDPASVHIIACLRAEDNAVRDVAYNWLTFYDRDPAPYLPGIIKLLKDAEPRTRRQAAFTLENLGAKARAALPALRLLLEDPDISVRGRATEAISRIDRKE